MGKNLKITKDGSEFYFVPYASTRLQSLFLDAVDELKKEGVDKHTERLIIACALMRQAVNLCFDSLNREDEENLERRKPWLPNADE